MKRRVFTIVLCVLFGLAYQSKASTLVSITAAKDNTIIQTSDGSTANSLNLIYVGCVAKSSNIIRRGLVYFDIASLGIPANAILDSARLSIGVSASANMTLDVQKMLSVWTEGTSNSTGGMGVSSTIGDVTWLHSSYPSVSWTTPGGDFEASISASKTISTSSSPTVNFTSVGLLADVQSWLASSTSNFGWLIRADDESLAKAGTIAKFHSKETTTNTSLKPTLNIYYSLPSLTAASSTLAFGPLASTSTIEISSNVSWQVSSSDSWLSVSPASGTTGTSLSVSVSDNATSVARAASVTLTGAGVDPVVISVSQQAPSLSVSTATIYIAGNEGNSVVLPVLSNTSWTVNSTSLWITTSTKSGVLNGSVTITPSANTGIFARAATMTISAKNSNPVTLTIVQNIANPVANKLLTVSSTKDNTIIQSASGTLGNSKGLIYVGCVAQGTTIIRRGLVYFDVSSIPATAVIDSARLNFAVNMASATNLSMYKVTSNWGEGTSYGSGGMGATAVTNDVTWLHSFYNSTLWTTPGGDYDAQSATSFAMPASVTSLSVKSEAMASQVQAWVAASATNFGWLIKADNESSSQGGVMNKYYSKETATNPVQVPTLNVYYSNPYLSVVSPTLTLDAEGNSSTININTNGSWTASSSASWLKVSTVSGSKSYALSVSATVNESIVSRCASVTISVPGTTPVVVTLTQDAALPKVTASVSSLSVLAGEGSSATFAISSNTAWNISSSDSWITVSPSSGTYDGSISITATQNGEINPRSASLTISAIGVSPVTIDVLQLSASPSLVLSASSLLFDAASSVSGTLTITSNTSWSVSCSDSWVKLSQATGTKNGTVIVGASTNSLITERTSTLTLSGVGVEPIRISITQTGATPSLSLSKSVVSMESAKATEATFTINSNTSWSISNSNSWVSVSAATGTLSQSIGIAVTANKSVDARTATIVVSAPDCKSASLTITQAGATPVLSVSASSLNLKAAISTASLTISSNTDWTVISSESWLSLSQTTGSGIDTLNITTEKNTTSNSRTATLTITGKNLSPVSVLVTQDVATEVESIAPKAELVVYPNPVKNDLFISSDVELNHVVITNLSGETVLTSGGAKLINISQLPSGVYVVRIYTQAGSLSKIIVKN